MIDLEQSIEGIDTGFHRLEHTFTGTSDPIRISARPSNLSAAIHPSAGTARIEYTLSKPDKVDAGTARWIIWDLGDVSTPKADALISAVTAIRGVSASQAVIEVCAK